LPGERFLIQQIDREVVLFDSWTEEEFVRFDPADADGTARAQGAIHNLANLDEEAKSFAHFWSGYFYAHAGGVSA
jgi:hypothetical protein